MSTNKLPISKMLTLSTAHLTESTAAKLRDEDYYCCLEWSLVVYEKEGFGWFILVPDTPEEVTAPGDLKECLYLARDNGCKWLCVDRDASTEFGEANGLAVYNW